MNSRLFKTKKVEKVEKVEKVVKFTITNDSVIEKLANGKFKAYKIQNIGPNGVYCNNDEFYGWEMF